MADAIEFKSFSDAQRYAVQRWAYRTLHVLYALGLRTEPLLFVPEPGWDALRRLAGGEPATAAEMRAALHAIEDSDEKMLPSIPLPLNREDAALS